MANHKKNAIKSKLNGHPEQRGMRPSFHALWHLQTLNVVHDLTKFEFEDSQESVSKQPRIVVMDTPIAHTHPNLEGVIDAALARDFSVFDEGAFVFANSEVPAAADLPTEDLSPRAELLSDAIKYFEARKETLDIRAEGATNDRKAKEEKDPKSEDDKRELENARETETEALYLRELVEDQLNVIRNEINGDEDRSAFANAIPGAHGTAVAGLIGARPNIVKLREPAFVSDVEEIGEGTESKLNEFFEVPYMGINPNCNIIPVSLTAAPNPRMVLGALHYVKAIEPDIVVIAAAWAEGIDREQNGWRWEKVDRQLQSVAEKAIVLCAAGNQATEALVYPASLSKDAKSNIWAVTACDPTGEILTYAPDILEHHQMIKTLSSQKPRSDRKVNIAGPFDARAGAAAKGGPPPETKTTHKTKQGDTQAQMNPATEGESLFEEEKEELAKRFWAFDLITLDPPGKQGYNPSPFADHKVEEKDRKEEDLEEIVEERSKPIVYLEIGSLFSRFSGTSAATAIAAGLISRVITQGEEKKLPTEEPGSGLFDLGQAKRLFGPEPEATQGAQAQNRGIC